jgi:hypothetical protein
MMKRLQIAILALTTIGFIVSFVAAGAPLKEMAVADIPDKTKLLNVELLGKYIFIHDGEKKANAEHCLYVYRYGEDQNGKPEARPENLVVSFHCEALQRTKVSQLVLTYGVTNGGASELREIQFAGSLVGHRVP